ncbi:unnamed protein product [Sphenostylis stenocarpa]|uniref:Uncharacterized protein n=1 Tax=Sphenostylis stenocarpa TaxID=92480 RepID=A0AA86SRS7_9FABA|nr:unnamed protein product [Sphenostylis stenocarpa]
MIPSHTQKELRIATGEEIPLILNEIDKPGCDSYILRQGSCNKYTIFQRLLEWCDNPELVRNVPLIFVRDITHKEGALRLGVLVQLKTA